MADLPLIPSGALFYGAFHAFAAFTSYNPDQIAAFRSGIDAVKSIGGNCISFYCEPPSVGVLFTLAQYRAMLKERINACEQKRCFFVPVLTYTVSNSPSQTAVIVHDAALFASSPFCAGLVVCDEPFLDTDVTSVATLAAWTAGVRAVVPSNLPVSCCTNPCGNNATTNTGNPMAYTGQYKINCDSVASYCDFFAFNPNATAPVAGDFTALLAQYPAKEIIWIGTAAKTSDGAAATFITAAQPFVGGHNLRGSNVFTLVDWSASAYGLFNSDYTPRTTRTAAFTAQLPTNVFPPRPRHFRHGNPRMNQLHRAGY